MIKNIIFIIACIIIRSNADFVDSISIPGANCKISILDSTSCFSSFDHFCNKYYHFHYNRSDYNYRALIKIEFHATMQCKLLIEGRDYNYDTYTDTSYRIPCDSIKTLKFDSYSTITIDTGKTEISWAYSLPTKRLAIAEDVYNDIIQLKLNGLKDSSRILLSRQRLHFSKVITPLSQIKNNNNSIKSTYDINGKLIRSNSFAHKICVMKENNTGKSIVNATPSIKNTIRK